MARERKLLNAIEQYTILEKYYGVTKDWTINCKIKGDIRQMTIFTWRLAVKKYYIDYQNQTVTFTFNCPNIEYHY